MKKIFALAFIVFLSTYGFSQYDFPKSIKSIYVFYGHHLNTRYLIDSGTNNLVGRKSVFSWEVGLNVDYPLHKKIILRTGFNGHFLFLNETTYGVIGNVPSGVNETYIHKYGKGIEYIESVSIGIPIKLGYIFLEKGDYNFMVFGGPSISIYFPASDEIAGAKYEFDNGNSTRIYLVSRHFKNYKSNKSIGISYPQLEWDFDVQATRKFKRYGAINLGIKAHIGTKRLEQATFVIWPTEPAYRSTGRFTLNRSYIGLYGAFTFGKNKK